MKDRTAWSNGDFLGFKLSPSLLRAPRHHRWVREIIDYLFHPGGNWLRFWRAQPFHPKAVVHLPLGAPIATYLADHPLVTMSIPTRPVLPSCSNHVKAGLLVLIISTQRLIKKRIEPTATIPGQGPNETGLYCSAANVQSLSSRFVENFLIAA